MVWLNMGSYAGIFYPMDFPASVIIDFEIEQIERLKYGGPYCRIFASSYVNNKRLPAISFSIDTGNQAGFRIFNSMQKNSTRFFDHGKR